MNVILYSDDINLIGYWEKSIGHESMIIDDLNDLMQVENSLIIMNLTVCLSDCGEMIEVLSNKNNKVLLLDHTPNIDRAKDALKYGAKGYGNVIMKEHFLISAIHTINDGMIWLHPSFTSMLIEEIKPSHKDSAVDLNILTDRQKEVALLLKDGLTYKVIAKKLNITPRTVKSHAETTYKKLGVKDRLGLALLLK